MCKEDVRLSRAASAGASVSPVFGASWTKALNANGERYSLTLGDTTPDAFTTPGGVVAAAKIGGVFYPLLGVSREHPAKTCSINDVGALIMEEIWVLSLDATNPSPCTVSESQWTQTQENI